MTRSVEIPEAAVAAAAEGLRSHSAYEEPQVLARSALEAALPYLVPAGLCACGKPATHVDADPDDADWACRVPAYLAPAARLDRREVMKTLLEFHSVTRIPSPSLAELQDLADSLMALAPAKEPASEFLCLQSSDGRHSTVAGLDGENEPLGYNHCGYCGTRLDW